MGQATREELAWAAGFFDGEGSTSIGVTRRKSGYEWRMVRVSINHTNLALLERFNELTGNLGTIYDVPRGPSIKAHWKDSWVLQFQSFESAQQVIATLWQWLGEEKRDQATRCFLEARAGNRGTFRRNRASHHGTASKYRQGCRCLKCNEAKRLEAHGFSVSEQLQKLAHTKGSD